MQEELYYGVGIRIEVGEREESEKIKRGAEVIVKELSTIKGQCVLGPCQWYDRT